MIPNAKRICIDLLSALSGVALEIFDNDGTTRVGRADAAPDFILKVNNLHFYTRFISWGNLGLGEAYMW